MAAGELRENVTEYGGRRRNIFMNNLFLTKIYECSYTSVSSVPTTGTKYIQVHLRLLNDRMLIQRNLMCTIL